jgi:hypothetical protein
MRGRCEASICIDNLQLTMRTVFEFFFKLLFEQRRLIKIISSNDSKLESSVVTENCHLILIIESEIYPFILSNRTVVVDDTF